MYTVSYIVLSRSLLENAIKLEIANALKERLTKYIMYNNTTTLYMNELFYSMEQRILAPYLKTISTVHLNKDYGQMLMYLSNITQIKTVMNCLA